MLLGKWLYCSVLGWSLVPSGSSTSFPNPFPSCHKYFGLGAGCFAGSGHGICSKPPPFTWSLWSITWITESALNCHLWSWFKWQLVLHLGECKLFCKETLHGGLFNYASTKNLFLVVEEPMHSQSEIFCLADVSRSSEYKSYAPKTKFQSANGSKLCVV